MIKVNLISKRSRAYKGKNWTRIVILSLFGLIGLYFIGVTLYLVIAMVITSSNIKKTNAEATSISSVMLANNEKLSRFLLTKSILSKITSLEKEKFHYKDYLDQISLLLPEGSLLNTVDFANKGWISLSVISDDLASLAFLEKALQNPSNWTGNKFFSGAYIESVSRSKTNSYITRLQLELKK